MSEREWLLERAAGVSEDLKKSSAGQDIIASEIISSLVALTRGAIRLGVAAVLWRDGQVLMGLRKGSHGAGTWSFPGGHVDEGEGPLQAIAREVLEETGHNAFELTPATFTHDVFTVEDRRYVTLYFAGMWDHTRTPRVCEPEKCAEWRWVTPGEWPGELFLPIKNLLVVQRLPRWP